MNPLIMIMNARNIKRACDAFRELTTDCVYATGYTELELKDVFADIIEKTDYTHYLVVSDDVVVTQRAVNAVFKQLEMLHVVVTGWCNHDLIEPGVNLTRTPLPGYQHPTTREEWDWWHFAEVLSYPSSAVPTYFAGMCLTGMSREMWQRFPFDCYPLGHFGGSDYHLSWRLQEAGIPIVGARDGFVFHLKKSWLGESSAPLFLGYEYQGTRWQLQH